MNVRAYAKINLDLRIVSARADGFHDIETIFHRIGLFDEIEIQKKKDISITSSNPDVPLDSRNLCWKAIELMQKEIGLSYGAHIHIDKHIPIGAGLGGGSSDAAAVLSVLPVLWDKPIDRKIIKKVALQLGSDVPYFLSPLSAYAEGRGDNLHYFQFELPYWVVVVNPRIHVSTAWAYKALSSARRGKFSPRQSKQRKNVRLTIDDIKNFGNDFEDVVFTKFPKIRDVKELLLRHGALQALLSGSGASVFGLFDSKDRADQVVHEASRSYFTHVTEPNFVIPS